MGTHQAALDFLIRWREHGAPDPNHARDINAIVDEAQKVADFLAADEEGTATSVVVWLRTGQVVDQTTGEPVVPLKRESAVTQLRDTEQYTLTVEAKDAKGYDVVGENFTASAADPNVAQVSQDGATITIKAGAPGSTVVTVTDGTISATEAVDVVAGNVATIQLTPGAITPQDTTGGTPATTA